MTRAQRLLAYVVLIPAAAVSALFYRAGVEAVEVVRLIPSAYRAVANGEIG